MIITSPHNERLKRVQKLARRHGRDKSGLFVAEGEDLLAEADAAGWKPVERYCAQGSGLPGTEVLPEVLDRFSQLGSGTRALAVYEQHWAARPSGPTCLALWDLHDPGNIGTIIRSAYAFGASCVALGPGCADPFSGKAVRASMGAVFHVSVARFTKLSQLPGRKIALVVRGGEPLTEVDVSGELSLLIGGERNGLPAEVVSECSTAVSIPIANESLNAAMAATVALYHVGQQ